MGLLSSLDPRNWNLSDIDPRNWEVPSPWWWAKPRPLEWIKKHPTESAMIAGGAVAAEAIAIAVAAASQDPTWLIKADKTLKYFMEDEEWQSQKRTTSQPAHQALKSLQELLDL